MTGLAEWLAGCVDDDEADALEMGPETAVIYTGDPAAPEVLVSTAARRHALREVEFKRAVLADHHPERPFAGEAPQCCRCAAYSHGIFHGIAWPCLTVRALAGVYGEEPGYEEAMS